MVYSDVCPIVCVSLCVSISSKCVFVNEMEDKRKERVEKENEENGVFGWSILACEWARVYVCVCMYIYKEKTTKNVLFFGWWILVWVCVRPNDINQYTTKKKEIESVYVLMI